MTLNQACLNQYAESSNPGEVHDLVERVGGLITPSWPLDQFITVNPFWHMTDQPIESVAAKLATRQGARLLMPRPYYRRLWETGHISEDHLQRAATEYGSCFNTRTLVQAVQKDIKPSTMHSFSMVLDRYGPSSENEFWHEMIVHQISQFCGAWFDQGQAQWPIGDRGGLYEEWLAQVVHERGIAIVSGLPRLHRAFASLPDQPEELIALALAEQAIPHASAEAYLHHLLLTIHGWASHCAWHSWQRDLGLDGSDDCLRDLLAIRLAWELVLYRLHKGLTLEQEWLEEKERWPLLDDHNRAAQRPDWIWQRASELAYQQPLARFLPAWGCHHQEEPTRSFERIEAVFCIDVRSEVLRRHLEAVSPSIRTHGFAGFFGVPATRAVPGLAHEQGHLPGLLAPQVRMQHPDVSGEAASENRLELTRSAHWQSFSLAPPAIFGYVESLGWLYGLKLLAGTPGISHPPAALNSFHGHGEPFGKPELHALETGKALDVESKAQIAFNALTGMGMTRTDAGVVLLVGHKSPTTNNPHATSLHCGACCGQSGSSNARALAGLLNDPNVRNQLEALGCDIAAHTLFLPAVHDTVTDEVTLLDTGQIPASHHMVVTRLESTLAEAGQRTRDERAERFGLSPHRGGRLLNALGRRRKDWSQVRPEWGLAGNASLIVAPRERSGHLKLAGRTFLHDYDWHQDSNAQVLELIMTAPMVVSHWINFQYYASTVDNRHYGAGNKVLHNVVGGHIGVFEGNGGDLRTGLPLQSLHDGSAWVHQPLRLSVFIEAPAGAIDQVIDRNPSVRNLFENGWLHLFRIDGGDQVIERRTRESGWHAFSGEAHQ
ncbi:DUF2309 domain-containing protein [uncultured Halovibrio sp.]|uniref:YbcC family protein n=1 Tax=uncultured Halovibrio sp. TaxID=985049 RepID=UPI0025D83200|nr:DUF2309 domain-containing protein [uncultured Halovibrio sp.]